MDLGELSMERIPGHPGMILGWELGAQYQSGYSGIPIVHYIHPRMILGKEDESWVPCVGVFGDSWYTTSIRGWS